MSLTAELTNGTYVAYATSFKALKNVALEKEANRLDSTEQSSKFSILFVWFFEACAIYTIIYIILSIYSTFLKIVSIYIVL